MKSQNARELDERIQKFLYRKFAEHPELHQDGRVVSKWRPSAETVRRLAANPKLIAY